MAKVCSLCKKKSQKVVRYKKVRSKINPTTTARQQPNLQWVKLSSGERVKACTKCIKTLTRKGLI